MKLNEERSGKMYQFSKNNIIRINPNDPLTHEMVKRQKWETHFRPRPREPFVIAIGSHPNPTYKKALKCEHKESICTRPPLLFPIPFSSRRRERGGGGFGNDRPEGSLDRTIRRIIDRPVKKGWKRRRERRIVCTLLPWENSFSASRRAFFHEKFLERERERESLSRRGRDLWMKIVDGTSVEENTFDRARIDRLSDFCPIFSFRCRFQCVYVAHFWGNLMTFLSCYLVFLGESLLSFWSYEFIVINLEGREI